MKRGLFIILIIAVTCSVSFAEGPENGIDVVVNGDLIDEADPVTTPENVVLVSAEPLFEELGMDISWDGDDEETSAVIGDFELVLPIGSAEVTVDNSSEVWDAPPQIIDGSTYVPVRSAGRAIGALVEWDRIDRRVTISTPEAFDVVPTREAGSDEETGEDETQDLEDEELEDEGLEDEDAGPMLHVASPPSSDYGIYASPFFVFGTTDSYSQVDLRVNEEPVENHDQRTGNFLTMVDVRRGEELPIVVEASDDTGTTTVEKSLTYPEAWEKTPREQLSIHNTHVKPNEDQVLSPGDSLTIVVQGSPGADAQFWIGEEDVGENRKVDMTEWDNPPWPLGEGIYSAEYTVDEQDVANFESRSMGQSTSFEPLPITVSLQRQVDGELKEVSRILPGKVIFSTDITDKVVEVKERSELGALAWLRKINDEGHFRLQRYNRGGTAYPTTVVDYLIAGTRFEVTGVSGNYYNVNLRGNDSPGTFIVHQSVVSEVEERDALEPSLSGVEVTESDKKASIRLKTDDRFSFLIDDEQDRLEINLYGLTIEDDIKDDTELLKEFSEYPDILEDVYLRTPGPAGAGDNSPDSLVVSSNDLSEGSMALTIEHNGQISGFDVSWEDDDLLIDIYKEPSLVNEDRPLEDKTIIVDPGHGGEDLGASGPGDIHEKDVALDMSLYLREILEEEGAEVIMTRTEDEETDLYSRTDDMFSPDSGDIDGDSNRDHDGGSSSDDDGDSSGAKHDGDLADLFISVHSNAHAQGADAVERHGLMTLYNYAHNEDLAEIILEEMKEHMELPAMRTWERNIAVLREPQVPSVLVEAGYMMHPEDNWHILHPREQKEFARSMKEGIREYFLSLKD